MSANPILLRIIKIIKIAMAFNKAFLRLLRKVTEPIARSVFKAYRHTTNKDSGESAGPQSGRKQHPMDDFFKSMLSKTNLSAPPLDQSTALKILNIQKTENQQLDPRNVLERYWTLYKKNDPEIGGTPYLQSKVFAAKQILMSQFPNATQIQQQFYKEVVEPEQQAQKKAQQQAQATEQKKQQKKQRDKEQKN